MGPSFIRCLSQPAGAIPTRHPTQRSDPSPVMSRGFPSTWWVHAAMGAAVGLQPVRNIVHDRTIVVTHCGRICLGRKKINFSQDFAGQAVGPEPPTSPLSGKRASYTKDEVRPFFRGCYRWKAPAAHCKLFPHISQVSVILIPCTRHRQSFSRLIST